MAKIAAHLAFGARLRAYAFDKYRTRNLEEYARKLARLTFLCPDVAAGQTGPMPAWNCGGRRHPCLLATWSITGPKFCTRKNLPAASRALSKSGLRSKCWAEAEMRKNRFGACSAFARARPGQPACHPCAGRVRAEEIRAHRLCRQGRLF